MTHSTQATDERKANYDKWDVFHFEIVNFPFWDGADPLSISYKCKYFLVDSFCWSSYSGQLL